jgi:hypothetical protein
MFRAMMPSNNGDAQSKPLERDYSR